MSSQKRFIRFKNSHTFLYKNGTPLQGYNIRSYDYLYSYEEGQRWIFRKAGGSNRWLHQRAYLRSSPCLLISFISPSSSTPFSMYPPCCAEDRGQGKKSRQHSLLPCCMHTTVVLEVCIPQECHFLTQTMQYIFKKTCWHLFNLGGGWIVEGRKAMAWNIDIAICQV